MNNNTFHVSDEDLQHYADNELDSEKSEMIARYLSQHPEAAQRVEQYRRLNQGLPFAHEDILNAPGTGLPGRSENRLVPRKYRNFGIAAGWLAIGISIGWSVQWQTSPGEMLAGDSRNIQLVNYLARPAMQAYATYSPEVLHPVEVTAEQQQHLVAWLTKRLGKSVSVPDLSAQGYSLLGGRLLPGYDKPAALFMYENQNGQRVTLNITRSGENSTQTAFLFSSEGTIRTFYWVDNEFGYAISGEIYKSPLLSLAQTVYHQLNL